MADEENRIEKLTNTAALIFIQLIAAPILIAVCLWIGNKGSTISENVSTAEATIAGHDNGVDNDEEGNRFLEITATEQR